ncbi:MAG: ribonuclease P protein component [Synechococcus sp.]|nr:ribonuclease P protein component [Synechococcus sp.]
MVLPASMRLRGHRCFDRLHRNGRRHHGPNMVLRVVTAKPELLKLASAAAEMRSPETKRCRCAVVISNKVSKRSVVRNRLRRQLHNHLRSRLEPLGQLGNHWLLVSLKPGALDSGSPLLEECDRLLKDAGLLP